MFNENPYYRNYRYNNYYRYNNFIPTYYPNKDYNIEIDDNKINSTPDSVEDYTEENNLNENNVLEEKKEEQNFNSDSSTKKQFRLGPLSINDSSINIFGFSIAIDDLIIIGLIILLLFQSDTDYILLIILGLLLLNIDFSSLNLF